MGKKKFYRTIVVEEKTYEYKIGRRHVKIKGIGDFWSGLIGLEYENDRFKVTPADIEHYIKHRESKHKHNTFWFTLSKCYQKELGINI